MNSWIESLLERMYIDDDDDDIEECDVMYINSVLSRSNLYEE